MDKQLEYHIVDAFVDPERPFSGNPAAVIVLPYEDSVLPDAIKQKLAIEFNLSETVFVAPVPGGEQCWSIRWFTPGSEVKLCGHATVAASYVLAKMHNVRHLKYKSIFHDRLEAMFDELSETVSLDFPNNEPKPLEADWVFKLKQAVIGDEYLDQIIDVQYSPTTGKFLIRLKDSVTSEILENIQPDIQKMLSINTDNLVQGVIVTSKPIDHKQSNVHFWSRYFAPWVGVNEDPVCGAAHTVLAPYWSRVYKTEHQINLDELYCQQVSKRSGLLRCQLQPCVLQNDRVLIRGQASIFSKGIILQKLF